MPCRVLLLVASFRLPAFPLLGGPPEPGHIARLGRLFLPSEHVLAPTAFNQNGP